MMMITALAPIDGDLLLPLADAKRHLKIEADSVDEDVDVRAFRDAAIDWIEGYTGRSLQRRGFRWAGGGFDRAVALPVRPVRAVTSVAYLVDDVATPIDPAGYRAADEGIVAASGSPWPVVRCAADGVRVEFEAGYGDALPLPPALMAAVKMLMAHLYRNREAASVAVTVTEVPFGVTTLCQSYRSWVLV